MDIKDSTSMKPFIKRKSISENEYPVNMIMDMLRYCNKTSDAPLYKVKLAEAMKLIINETFMHSLNKTILTLPKKSYTILMDRYQYSYSLAEISEKYKMLQKNVKLLLNRIFEKIIDPTQVFDVVNDVFEINALSHPIIMNGEITYRIEGLYPYLSSRTSNALKRYLANHELSFEELEAMASNGKIPMRGIGVNSIDEIQKAIHQLKINDPASYRLSEIAKHVCENNPDLDLALKQLLDLTFTPHDLVLYGKISKAQICDFLTRNPKIAKKYTNSII